MIDEDSLQNLIGLEAQVLGVIALVCIQRLVESVPAAERACQDQVRIESDMGPVRGALKCGLGEWPSADWGWPRGPNEGDVVRGESGCNSMVGLGVILDCLFCVGRREREGGGVEERGIGER